MVRRAANALFVLALIGAGCVRTSAPVPPVAQLAPLPISSESETTADAAASTPSPGAPPSRPAPPTVTITPPANLPPRSVMPTPVNTTPQPCERIPALVAKHCMIERPLALHRSFQWSTDQSCAVVMKGTTAAPRFVLGFNIVAWRDEIGVELFDNLTSLPPAYRTLGIERVPSWTVDGLGDGAILLPYPPEHLTPRRELLDDEGFTLAVRGGDRVYLFSWEGKSAVANWSSACNVESTIRIAREFINGLE